MSPSMADAFAAIGRLSKDDIWAAKLQQQVADVLASKDVDKTRALAKIYLEAEREMISRSDGEWRDETLRERLRPEFEQTAEAYPILSLVFLPSEKQLLAIATVFLRTYADELLPVMGPKSISGVFAGAFSETPFRDVKVSLERGFEASGMRFQDPKACAEIVYTLLERWYEKTHIPLGTAAARRTFERAFRRLDASYGFLPTAKNLLGATPLGVLSTEKAERLHELETQTSLQAKDIRASDASLRRQAERLRQTVEELEKTKLALEKTSKARSEFIDVVAHQFRTPLSSIRWNGELLVDEFIGKPDFDPVLLEATQNVRIKSVFLIETLDRVFTSLDIETGKILIDPKPAFFWEVIQDAYAALDRDFSFRGMKWKFNKKKEQLQQIPLDRTKMISVMKIIIGNALSYGAANDTIVADLEQRAVNGRDYLVASVADSGLGIEAKDLDRVFEKFYRAQPAILKIADGTGLGLFITKHVAEAHGGMAWAESEGLGKGATFHVALPLVPPKPEKKDEFAVAQKPKADQPKIKRQTII